MKKTNKKQLQEKIPNLIPIIPTIDVVVFPNMVVPLLILDEKIIEGINKSLDGDKKVLLLAAKQPENSSGPIGVEDLYKVGTIANIMRTMQLPDGGIKILAQGMAKAEVEEIEQDETSLYALIKPIDIDTNKEDQNKLITLQRKIIALVEQLSATGKIFGPDFQILLSQMEEPERVAEFIISHLTMTVTQAQELLEKKSMIETFESIYDQLTNEIEISKVQDNIQNNTRESINKSQREYFLREQLKSIHKELGDEVESDMEEMKSKIATLPIEQEAKEEATRQLRRLERTSPDSMESTVLRNHIEWIINLPWGVYTKDDIDIPRAKKILDEDHYGLEVIKDRLLDFLSVRALKDDCNTPILCFSGPPGVGKTSLGKSIAKALGRKFIRLSLGGVHDESEIRGHRRTYVGALPGRFIQAIKKAGSMNPLIMIDEIDKIGQSQKGDPSAALLEVLDPEQNNTFYDNYMGIHFDLSKTLFITTANDLSNIPGPLRDRMEVIQLPGYTHEEKIEIAKRHLINKAIEKSGLIDKGFSIADSVLTEIVMGYTRESGVRELERFVTKLCSKFARALVETKTGITFDSESLRKYLGPKRILDEDSNHINKIGVTNGLAWTPYGGEVLQVEAVLMRGNGRLLLTGQLGDVMKESAQAAVTYAKAHGDMFGINLELFEKYDLHIHLPAGAIPKDGPSAGITLLSSILSAYTGQAVDADFAMTGELNLQGNVLPIGGLKEKILAAKRRGLKNIILPKSNRNDLEESDEKIYNGINVFWVDDAKDVLDRVLVKKI
ncbi:endopeptidase La [Candidatus Dependentiae bacterium]|nr:endopeptidase La [Candidatus Dependentiae bacterium]MCG2756659.1 endopeptidase La [Candidatus Dependentiae bacterium]